MSITRRFAVAVLLLSLSVIGCGKSGPPTVPVEGIATYQGKPLPLGSVLFVPQDKHSQAKGSKIDANGHYRVEVVPGKYQVEVRMFARLRGQPELEGEGAKIDMPEVDWIIPEKYSHSRTSGLEFVVEADKENKIDLPMK